MRVGADHWRRDAEIIDAGIIMTWFAKRRGVKLPHATFDVMRLAQVAADWENSPTWRRLIQAEAC